MKPMPKGCFAVGAYYHEGAATDYAINLAHDPKAVFHHCPLLGTGFCS